MIDVEKFSVMTTLDGSKIIVDKVTKTVSLTIIVEFNDVRKENDPQFLLKYTNETLFYLENFDEIFDTDSDIIRPDKGLIRVLLDIVIPMIRGILIAKTAGTSLASLYLPLSAGNNLIK
jgi:hypothetical protein